MRRQRDVSLPGPVATWHPRPAREHRWSGPPSPYAAESLLPLRGEETAAVRPYVLAETTLDLGVIREHRLPAQGIHG
ncbi:hypothetical protein ACWF94_08460 [Streptomyces sp. NPDC055078]